MQWTLVLISLAILASAIAQDELPLAEPCDDAACQLPSCRCSLTTIPGGLAARDVPQFVLLTFDDGVNVINIETYRELIYGRVNRNSCPVGTTFYVSHEYTNYVLVNELYNNGLEIALHSISHLTNQTYWQVASVEDMRREFSDQKTQISHFANIPYEAVKGTRIPFLQMTGNSSFVAMAESNLEYDCSWPTINSINPGLWPYTLDYASTQECIIPPCPTAAIPGPWVLPMISWIDLNGTPCSMVDSCFSVPPLDDEDRWFDFILSNFERHYLGTRAPFGFYIHEWYVASYTGVKGGLIRFLNMINNMNDVFMVNSNEVIDWVRDPIPLNEYLVQPCKSFIATSCPTNSCGPLTAAHTEMSYYMQICNVCPATYPWVGNPLGL